MVSWGNRRSDWTARVLTGACIGLAVFCVVLAAAFTRERDQARCWRDMAARGAWPGAAPCREVGLVVVRHALPS
jgi:hypothetical protein